MRHFPALVQAVSHSTFTRFSISNNSLTPQGHAARGVRDQRRLPQELLRLALLRTPLLRRLRPHGAVRPRQRRRRRPHEASRGVSQAGMVRFHEGLALPFIPHFSGLYVVNDGPRYRVMSFVWD